jgi:membrane associated rhomboid family serine protease
MATPYTFILLLLILVCSLFSLNHSRFFMRLILHPYSIVHNRQYYRLLTADLVHNDLAHLGLNLFLGYIACAGLEEHMGAKMLWIYLASCLAGTVIMTWRHRNDFDWSATGASGSILGCLMGLMILKPQEIGFYLPGIGGVRNAYVALLYVAVLTWQQRKSNDQLISHGLHFYGAIGGIAITYLIV